MRYCDVVRWEAKFREKMICKECYATDHINLVGLDWIDEFNFIHFSDENDTHQTFTFEPTKWENLMRGRNQCLQVAEIPHSSIHIQP
ncbi:unnamed protein product [Hymenolepis diminuta]|uniref:Reverse transcriptase domain-containing protein n=1 Tax=Hymenolepis diminuta TaxID=6216 RepID=A0A0R3SWE4_HYMDI|nr:unnamed protein product [Hymenolepis diminuta]